ncbi:MAG: aminotransferase class I/II-fold pyridoxal phosphate-dependent enzyme [Proteobacteria bacterium]|nr:aminotransferase class I/II-fold pyridoxal phosphate-dependent enzyme [Pseudomonadota bacterium]
MAVVSHGGRVEQTALGWRCRADDVLDLSTGVYPVTDLLERAAWLQRHAHLVARYPDPDGEPARSALARCLDVDPDHVLITAGAQAAIEVVFRALPWRSLALFEPHYGEVRRVAERDGVRVESARSGEAARLPAADAVWITTPDSLTGQPRDVPPRAGVVDESYASLAERRRRTTGPRLRIGSLTKTFSLPGLRLGYVVGPPDALAALRAHLPPWPAATLALHWLPELLPTWEALDRRAATARQRLHQLLLRHGWTVHPSRASFVLGRPLPTRPPHFARERILVREFPEWPSLTGALRVGLPADEAEWRRLEAALC